MIEPRREKRGMSLYYTCQPHEREEHTRRSKTNYAHTLFLMFLQKYFGDFGNFGVSFVSTVAGCYTRWGGPRLSVQDEPLIVLTWGP